MAERAARRYAAGAGSEIRVAKLMAARGLCSRREAERLIAAGQVRVGGRVVREPGTKVRPDAEVEIAPEARTALERRLTVVLHKPAGVVSLPSGGDAPAAAALLTADRAGPGIPAALRTRVAEEAAAFHVAGRLDRASRGLLLLTEDGRVARAIIGSRRVPKVYRVTTAEAVSAAQLRKLRGRIVLDGRILAPMQVRRLGPRKLQFVLVEGRKHQIRRVCRRVGLHVVDLFREAVGPFRLGTLPPGRWRLARREELEELWRLVREVGLQRTGG